MAALNQVLLSTMRYTYGCPLLRLVSVLIVHYRQGILPFQRIDPTAALAWLNEGGCVQALTRLDRTSPQFPHQLSDILGRRKFEECVRSLEANGVALVIEYLDKVPSSHKLESLSRRAYRRSWKSYPATV